MLTIGKASKATGLSTKAIRDYEKARLLQDVHRSLSGYRLYSDEDIATLHFIRRAREVNFSLRQIARLLQLRDDPRRQSREVKALVGAHIQENQRKLSLLQQTQDLLQQWHDDCRGNTSPDCAIIERIEGTTADDDKARL